MADEIEGLGDESGDSIDKVREILFGAQQRKADQRFGDIKQEFERQISASDDRSEEARRGIDRRIELMETKLVDEMKKLSQRLDDSLASFRKEADQSNTQLRDSLAAAEKSLQSEIEAQAKQTQARLADLKADLDRAASDLDGDKTSRDELGGYLMELGMRLSSDLVPSMPKKAKSDGQPGKK
ncbi:MAG: hypothetical protein ACKVH0_07270 [Alphaproteobacteria bacterium]